MAFNVSTFRNNMVGDGARPNLFEVSMTFPVGGTAAQRNFTFMCKTAQLPGSTVGSVIVPYFGREVKFAGNRTFADWTVTIINDENFQVRNVFESWMNSINQHASNLRSGVFPTPLSYVRDANVIQYGKAGRVLKTYQFKDMFPIDVSPIDLDWGANDTIEEFAVTFQYQYWLSDTTDLRASTITTTTNREGTLTI